MLQTVGSVQGVFCSWYFLRFRNIYRYRVTVQGVVVLAHNTLLALPKHTYNNIATAEWCANTMQVAVSFVEREAHTRLSSNIF